MKGRNYIILGIIIVAILVGAIVIWRTRQSAQATETVRSATVERGTLLVSISASGTIEPRQQVNLSFDQPGLVTEVTVAVGDEVKAGDMLAKLDTERLAIQVAQAQAALESAQAQLRQLTDKARAEDIAAAEANVRAAEAQVKSAIAQRDQITSGPTQAQIAAAEAELASAITEQKKAEDLHDKTMQCFEFFDPRIGKERTICPALGAPEEQARYRLEAADQALEAAQENYDQLLAGSDDDQLRAAEANVQAAIAQRDAAQAQRDLLLAGATEEQIAAAEAQVEQAQTALEEAQLALELAALRAPFDGTIAVVNVEENEMAPSTLPAITLLDRSQFHITVSVDEIDVARLAEGQGAQVTVEAFAEESLTGTVERIAPAATFEGGVVYYDVTIGLAETDLAIRADMTANATIIVQELSDVLLIPSWVVRVDSRTGQTYVDKRVGERTERVDIELGTRHEGTAQVLEGLSEGDVAVWIPESRFRSP